MVITAALSEIDTKGYAVVTLLHCQTLHLPSTVLELLCLLNYVSLMSEANIFQAQIDPNQWVCDTPGVNLILTIGRMEITFYESFCLLLPHIPLAQPWVAELFSRLFFQLVVGFCFRSFRIPCLYSFMIDSSFSDLILTSLHLNSGRLSLSPRIFITPIYLDQNIFLFQYLRSDF